VTNENLDDLPTRAPGHVSETKSRIVVRALLTDPYFLVRSEEERDYGVDFVAEILENGTPSNWHVHIQVKSVSCDANADGSISRSVARTNLNYLLRAPASLYVIYNSKTKILMYRWAEDVLGDCRASGKSWKDQASITVRCRDVLDGPAVVEINRKLSGYFRAASEMRAQNPSHEAILRQMDEIASAQSEQNGIAAILTREASVHFQRGQESGARTEFKLAATNLRDALRLADHDQVLRTRISVVLGGVLIFLGDMLEAEAVLTSVLPDLEASGDCEFTAFALGNLGLARLFQERPAEAGALLERAIGYFELNDNHYDLARTYQLLAQSSLIEGDLRQACRYLDGFTASIEHVEPLAAVPLLSAAWGTRGNMELGLYKERGDEQFLEAAKCSFSQSFEIASSCGTLYTILLARASLAQCTWFDNQLEKARLEHLNIASAAGEYVTIELDALYNAALILFEMDRAPDACAELEALRPRYAILGAEGTVEKIDQTVAASHAKSEMEKNGGGKTGRNAPCPCGSGKKYKRCCWTSG